MGWSSAERRQIAIDLHDHAIQVVAGNLLRFDAVRALLHQGRIEEARTLLGETIRAQRTLLDRLRWLMGRISPDQPSVTGSQPSSS